MKGNSGWRTKKIDWNHQHDQTLSFSSVKWKDTDLHLYLKLHVQYSEIIDSEFDLFAEDCPNQLHSEPEVLI